MPHLQKPDMRAVLERTHLSPGTDSLLLPTFEAASNAIHSISDRFGDAMSTEGRLQISFDGLGSPQEFESRIADNGLGLDSRNMKAFQTPFTGNKLRRGGKGFGRFVVFKVYESTQYSSESGEEADHLSSFTFDIYSDEEILPSQSPYPIPFDRGCLVRYSQVREAFHNTVARLAEETILNALTRNFLTYLLQGIMPRTEVIIDGVVHNLRDHFQNVIRFEESHDITVSLRGTSRVLRCDVSRVDRAKPFENHSVLFFADNRVVGEGRNIERKVGEPYFTDKDGRQYLIIASISGEFLDEVANQPRTALDATEDEIVSIIDEACTAISRTENSQHEAIKNRQELDVKSLLDQHPLLRFGLQGETIAEYIAKKPNGWRVENFVSDLAVRRHREERRYKALLAGIMSDNAAFQDRKIELLGKRNDSYRDSLAEYVIHRRAVIDIADFLRGADEDGKMSKEDTFHALVYPRNQDSKSTRFYQHNLCLLDERLAFVSYISSDRTLHGGRRSLGDKIIDIALYEECVVLRGEGTNTLVLVEFKKPGRNNYRSGIEGSDPIGQVLDTVEHIRERKSLLTTDGKTIEIPNGTQVMAYIVADLEPTLTQVALRADFSYTWDRRGMYRYHEKLDVYTGIIGYNKLITDAEKRNAAFFDILLRDADR